MLAVSYIVLTFIALFLIPGLFISRRLNVPFTLTNILRLIKITFSKYNDKEEKNDKSGAMGNKLGRNRTPKHVAIILDGNRRWAKKQGIGTSEGHEAGADSVMKNAKYCFALGTTTISIFAFSTENWERPEDEVNSLMALFENQFNSEIPYFQRYEIKISVIGNRSKIPESLLRNIRDVEEATKSYEGKHLIVALDYSGRFDILQACKSLATKARDGLIEVEDIDEKAMEKELMTKCSEFPNPDLMIRTSGEQRISNFFLWQSAYTELYFTPVLWPDFGETEYLEALTWYQQRQRRFGRRV